MQTVFRDIFGASPLVRILDFFLDNKQISYALTDLIREEGIAHQTAKPIWTQLIQAGVLVRSGRRGKAQLYRLDEEHPLIHKLVALDYALVESGISINT